ncbi:hypothetical protein [Phormidium sp. CCY1219]|nr:hypothetical protein [Phormidium sp. CCY1219]MEB3828197.1 hypothetical protein [Phormidium sp. CCY1219]
MKPRFRAAVEDFSRGAIPDPEIPVTHRSPPEVAVGIADRARLDLVLCGS